MAIPLLGFLLLPFLNTLQAGALNPFQTATFQTANRLIPLTLLSAFELVTLLRRGVITDEEFSNQMSKHGFSTAQQERFKRATEFFPSPQDLVNWQAKEVFEEDAVKKFGTDAEFENLDLTLFEQAGVTAEQARNYWLAHWQHPSFQQIADMLHRDVLTAEGSSREVLPTDPEWEKQRLKAEALMFEWFRLVEIPPFWRNRMRLIADLPFTRVDIRRMWDLGVANDNDVIRAYLDQGYDLEHAQALLLFAKIERRLPDLEALYRNGWITLEEFRDTIVGFGLPLEKAEDFVRQKVQNLDQPFRVARERDLTKAEIVKGVQKQVITPSEGTELMMRLGYDRFEAEFILAINLESEGSPETPGEFAKLTEAWRKSVGLPAFDIPATLVEAEHRLLKAKQAFKEKQQLKRPAKEIEDARLEILRAEAALKGLRSAISKQLPPSLQR